MITASKAFARHWLAPLTAPARAALPKAAAAVLLALTSGAWAAKPPTPPTPPVDLSPVPARMQPSPLPDGWEHGAFMEIFVRGYQDSDGDGIGDLRGLIRRLDYLQALGVKGLWLMPIQASADHDHGYATVDYRRIEPQYGTLEDFDTLIREAHRRGIGVVMDYILNHSARQHPLFTAAQSKPDSPWRDWFVWSDAPLKDLQAWTIFDQTPWHLPEGARTRSRYFATFGQDMPDFNMRNPAVVRYHEDSLRFWLNRGLDGYRLDAVPHLIENNARDWNDQPESRVLTGAFTRLIKSYPRRHVVCEATAEPTVYAQPEICGSAFAFGLERAIITAAKGDHEASEAAVAKVASWFTQAPLSMATMLSNHDIFAGQRAWDQFGGDERRYRLAAATYLLLPGTPFIYYGEEIGQAGLTELPGDQPLRAPMSWTAEGGFTRGQPFRPLSPNRASHNAQAQEADPASLLHFYRAMLALRNGQPSLARGSYEAPVAQGQVLAFQREWQGERTLVAINYGETAARLALPVSSEMVLRQLYPAASAVGGRTEGMTGGMSGAASVMSATAVVAPAAATESASASSSMPSSVQADAATSARSARASNSVNNAQLDLMLPPLSVQVYRLR
ncbi:alpha-amylase family glycosyl hydrolase [Roseateles terrae]|uniref:Glycosidase n=1 Tax=Roseateles terrae TaxID=431060 RepID=A0ABR6GQC4_9BURK|nr:alpha-amylase family glycosyl hydrolase [Roseateles terrae]MBB3194259.1 glycosidase [Roseateles terrae]